VRNLLGMQRPVKVVVLADTHIKGSGIGRLPEPAWTLLRSADAILHAGDVVGAEFLAELRELAPVHAVLGNNDLALVGVLPEHVELDLGGVRLAMTHDSGDRRGREQRMHAQFPDAALVVFGHSHIPWDAPGVGGQHLFNPGSVTQRRRQPNRTLGVVHITAGVARPELVTIP
jgi:putative phosphoesterase